MANRSREIYAVVTEVSGTSTKKDDDSNERNFSRETTLDVFNPGAEYTWSKQDVRHAFNISSERDARPLAAERQPVGYRLGVGSRG